MTAAIDFDVAIIGLGPVGATLANLLGQSGISTQVFEREAALYPLPRAVHFDDEVMRVFQTVGIADSLLPLLRVNPGMRFVDKDHQLLLDWPRPDTQSPQGWHPSYRFHQPELEQLLRQSISNYDTVDVRLNVDVVSIEQDSEGCDIHYQQKSSGTDRILKARSRYVVGCDGANSIVRQCMGAEYIDFGLQERWLVVDAILKTEKPELGDFTVQYCDPERPHTYVRCPGARRRWEFSLPTNADTEGVVDDTTLWNMLSPWV
nr:FAD-dependent monooxygenase [Granulosicoccus sp.]